jgi:hypothetical protein
MKRVILQLIEIVSGTAVLVGEFEIHYPDHYRNKSNNEIDIGKHWQSPLAGILSFHFGPIIAKIF